MDRKMEGRKKRREGSKKDKTFLSLNFQSV